jgi:general secretion pathway protein A
LTASASAASVASSPSPANVATAASATPADATAAAVSTTISNTAEVLASAQLSEAAAWRELAALWPLALADGDPCDAALRLQAACWRSNLGLAALRALGRPGVLTLYPPPPPGAASASAAVYVIVVGLSDDSATLRLGGRDRRLPLTELAGLWRGDFGTLWRTPPGFRDAAGEPAADLLTWLEARLPEPAGAPLASRVQAFQVAHGLKPDGRAGPMTLMQIQRVHGADEPRLRVDGNPPAPTVAAAR